MSFKRRSESDDGTNDSHDDEYALDVYPGTTCVILASGAMPASAIDKANLPFSQVLLWHSACYVGPLNVDDEAVAEGRTENTDKDEPIPEITSGPVATSILSCGRFSYSDTMPSASRRRNILF